MKTSTLNRTGNVVVLVALMLFTVVPLLGVLATALQPAGSNPSGFSVPWPLHWTNFVDAWNIAQIGPLMISSSLIVIGVVPVAITLATMAGFGLAQHRVPLRTALALLFVAGLTVPGEALISPLYYEMQGLGVLNSRWAVILPLIGLYMPFGVFWMQTHFRSVPEELIEAARVDGASTWRVFLNIQLPLARSAIAALMILFFLWTWNQFVLALVLINDPLKRTVAGALGSFQGQYSTNIVLLCAGALAIVAPSLIIFVAFQRQFIGALLAGSGK